MATHRTGHSDAIENDTAYATGMDGDLKDAAINQSSSLSKASTESPKNFDEKHIENGVAAPVYDEEAGEHEGHLHVASAKELVTNVLHVDDDPTLNPWTFRMWFLGKFMSRPGSGLHLLEQFWLTDIGGGLSLFGSVLATIYYFKPQTVYVSVIFLAVISYILGELMAKIFSHQWLDRPLVQSPQVQPQGTCRDCHHGFGGCQLCPWNRSFGCPEALLLDIPQCWSFDILAIFVSAFGLRYRRFAT